MWCNFDQVHLIAIYAECAAIEDELQREINATSNKVDGSGNASFSNLEDCPITPEEQAEFDRKFAELQATNPSKKLK